MAADREEIRRGLQILYPPDHGIIELDALWKSGGISPGHFDDIEKLLDEIERYDGRDEVLAIYTALNKIKPEAFKRLDHPLEVSNRVASGLRIDAEDVARVTGILFDLDPKRGNGNNKDSTTEEEHQAGLDAADSLKHKLSLMGWPEPVMGSSGNGATLRYLTDLPAAVETEELISRMLKAANNLLPDHLKELVEVDGAMFDRPRISKVFGTMTRKGPGTTERPHRRAKLISAPEKLEPVQIDSIMKLVNAGRRSDPIADNPQPNTSKNRIKSLSEVENDPDIKPCLKEIILNKGIKQLEEVSAHEHKGRVAIVTELILAGYSDEALHEFFSRLEDYDPKVTTVQINQIIKKFVDGKGGKTWLCQTLRINEVVKFAKCKGCKWVGHGQDPEIVLAAKIIADPLVLNDSAFIKALATLRAQNSVGYDLLMGIIKRAHIDVKVGTIDGLVDKYDLEASYGTERTIEPPAPLCKEASDIIDSGKAFEYIYRVWQKRVEGNEYLGKSLILSRAVQSCLNASGLHIYSHGMHGHGKSYGMEVGIKLIPPEYRMDEDISPLAIHYASKNGMLLEGTTLLIDEMVWNDTLAGIIKRVITRFQEGAGHLTVIDGEPVLVRTQPRLAIWTNSADLQADEQLRDRFLDEPIDEGGKQVSEIMEFQKDRDTLPVSTKDSERETAICQDIIRDIASKTFAVKIPFAKRIKIATTEGTRGYNIFSDLIKGFAILRYKQRQTDELCQLIATEDDFNSAKDVYEGSKGHSAQSYGTAETNVLKAIIEHGHKATYKDIADNTGLSEARVREIVNGRGKDEQRRHGLRYKCPQLEIEKIDITIRTEEDADKYNHSFEKERRTRHINELTLPASFSIADGDQDEFSFIRS